MKNSRNSIISEISDWLKLLALVVLVAEAAIIAAMKLTPTDKAIHGWYPVFMLAFLVVIVVGLFFDRYQQSIPSNSDISAKNKSELKYPTPTVNNKVRTLHYVTAFGPARDFFNRFYGALSSSISMIPDLNIQYYSTALDPYTVVVDLFSTIPVTDAIMIVPKRLREKKQTLNHLRRALQENSESRLIFVDREPPRELLMEYSNTCYVGINNRRVGIMAAYALYRSLNKLGENRLYVIVNGPGGEDRAKWCIKTINELDSNAKCEVIEVKDLDRIDTSDRIIREQHRLLNDYPRYAIGIFAANDETATSICHEALGGGFEHFRIIGCDATREMRQWVDNRHSIAFATIYNDLHTDETINTIIKAMSERTILPLDPHFFPRKLTDGMMDNIVVSNLWKDASWTV